MNVVWTEEAESDLYAWLDYMAERNPAAGEQVVEMVLGAVELLPEMPLMGKAGAVFGTREFKVSGTPLRVIYGVHDELIHILFVPHDRQQWPPKH